ncbi:MAG: hypothetical protein AAF560_27660 [Acidobacteriota bacterium]
MLATHLLIAATLPIALAAPAAADNAGVDVPRGRFGEAVVALLNYNRETCDGIAGKVVSYWSGSSSPDDVESVREYVVQRHLSELAQSREAADLVEKLMPRVREEADRETSSSLVRLHEMEVELCDTVAYPNGTRQEFEDELRRLLDRIEQEEAELGRLLVVPPDRLQSAMDLFLSRIQLAGVEAEGEYRDYLESLKPPPREPTLQERMDAWHSVYAPAVLPTKQALGKYLQGRKANDNKLVHSACREITAAVIPLLRSEQVFHAPIGPLRQPLKRAFVQIRLLATECVAGRWHEVEGHYTEMQTQLAIASGILSEFSLRP